MQNKIAKEASLSFAGMTFGQVVRYLFTILVSRLAGAELLGFYAIGNTITRLSEVTAKMGLDEGVLKFVSRDSSDRDSVLSSIGTAIKFSLLGSIALMLLQFFFSDWLAVHFFNEVDPYLVLILKCYALSIPFASLMSIMANSTQGYKTLRYKILVTEILNSSFLLSFFIFLGLVLNYKFAILFSPLITMVSAFMAIGIVLFKKFDISPMNLIKSSMDYTLVSFSIPIMFAAVISTLLHWIDILMIGAFLDVTEVGLYHPAARTSGLIRVIFISFASIFSPIISELHAKKDFSTMNYYFKLVTRWILIITIPVVILFLLVPEKIMLIFGAEFSQTKSAFSILVFSAFIQALFGLGGSALVMTGYSKINLYNIIFAIILNIAINFILIPKIGLEGAAIGTLCALLSIGVLRLVENIYLNNLFPFNFHNFKPIIAGLFTFGIIYYSSIVSLIDGFASVLFLAMIVSVVFIFIVYLIGFENEEKDVIKSTIQTIKEKFNER